MDHDRMFKQLLTTFFVEFIELFCPEVAAYLRRDSIEFMDKEVFTDLTAGERHEVDLLVKAKFHDADAFFLIHVENQASAQEEFPKRMFAILRGCMRSTICRSTPSRSFHTMRRSALSRRLIRFYSPTRWCWISHIA